MARITQAEVIARLLSNSHPPSLTAMRRAQQIINSLEFHGYVIAPMHPDKDFLQGRGLISSGKSPGGAS